MKINSLKSNQSFCYYSQTNYVACDVNLNKNVFNH